MLRPGAAQWQLLTAAAKWQLTQKGMSSHNVLGASESEVKVSVCKEWKESRDNSYLKDVAEG